MRSSELTNTPDTRKELVQETCTSWLAQKPCASDMVSCAGFFVVKVALMLAYSSDSLHQSQTEKVGQWNHLFQLSKRQENNEDGYEILAVFQKDFNWNVCNNKKLSYRRETARQLPTWREGGARPAPSLSAPSGYTDAYGWIRKPQRTYGTSSVPSVKRTLRWIGHSRSFKVILIGAGRNPEWSFVVMCN